MAQTTDTPPQNTPPANAPAANPPQSPATLPASDRDLRWRRTTSNPRVRMALILGAIVLLVAGFFLWRYFTSYESTDDAQVDGHLNSISARVSGHVTKL